MSDEIRTPKEEEQSPVSDAPAEEAAAAPETEETPAAPLSEAEELERLRETFQTEYDKAVAANEMPEIQELDDGADAAEDEDAQEPSDETEEPQADESGKKEKDPKKKALVLGVVLALVCVFIVLPLVGFLVLTIKVPNLTNFISAGAKGAAATDPAEQISYYTEALGYCDDNDTLASFTQELTEKIAYATYQKDGYSAALSYAKQNLSEEELAAPKTKEFRSLLAVAEKIDAVADGAEAAVSAALENAADADAVDYAAIAKSLDAPEAVNEDVAAALKTLGAGLAAEKTAQTKDDEQTAIASLMEAYSDFRALGAKGQTLLESIVVRLFNKGYAYEAQTVLDSNFAEEEQDASHSEAFTEVKAELAQLKGCGVDVYAIAEAALAAKKTDIDSLTAAVNADLGERGKTAIARIAQTLTDAAEAEAEKNLTKANLYYTTALTAENSFSLPTEKTAQRALAAAFALGDTQNANQIAETYLGEEALAGADDAFKALYKEFQAVYTAQNAVNEVFYPFYYNAMYSGGELNKAEINAALDALLTEDAAAYTPAFVSYYKYLAEAFTDRDLPTMESNLLAYANAMKDHPLMYGGSLVQLYATEGKTDEAIALAKQILEINTADDVCNSMLALEARMNGDLQASAAAAEKGMELSGTRDMSAYQAAVAYLLLGDYEKAYELANELYKAQLTTDNCDLLKVIAVTYTGDDAALKEKLDAASKEIDQTYEQYQVEFSENTAAIIAGTKTLEDVLLSGTYSLR